MSALKKTVTAAVLAVISFSAFAGVSSDGRLYEVKDFLLNARIVQNNLLQSATGYNNSCGPTSMLFASNYYGWKLGGPTVSVNMESVAQSRITIQNMYSGMRKTLNTETKLEELRDFARGTWGWTQIIYVSPSNGVAYNVNSLISSLSSNVVGITVLKPNYSGNPAKPFGHIVVMFEYYRDTDEYGRAWNDPNNTRNNDRIYWFEPYWGKTGYVLRKEIPIAFDTVEFAYLKAGR